MNIEMECASFAIMGIISVITFAYIYLDSRYHEQLTRLESFGRGIVAVMFANILAITIFLFVLFIKVLKWKLLNM